MGACTCNYVLEKAFHTKRMTLPADKVHKQEPQHKWLCFT